MFDSIITHHILINITQLNTPPLLIPTPTTTMSTSADDNTRKIKVLDTEMKMFRSRTAVNNPRGSCSRTTSAAKKAPRSSRDPLLIPNTTMNGFDLYENDRSGLAAMAAKSHAKSADSSATTNNKPTTRSTANNNNSMALATTNQLDSNDPDVRRSHCTNNNPFTNRATSTGGKSNGRQTNRRQSKDKSANAQTITSTEMIAQAKSDISNIIIPTVPNNNDVVMIQEDDRCNTGSEQRAGSSTRGSSNRRPSKDKSANAKTIPSIDMIAQAMFDINASVTSDKKQDITIDQLVDGTKKAHELDENGEQNTNGRAVVHHGLFRGGDYRDTNRTDLGIVSITQTSTRMELGEVFGKSELQNLIAGSCRDENGWIKQQQYEALVKKEIDSFNLKDFEMTRYDKKNGLAAPPTDDQLAKIHAINKQYNPNEAKQTASSNGRVAAITDRTKTFHNGVRGRPHSKDSSLQIITAPSLSSLSKTLKCVYQHSDSKKTLSVNKALMESGGSLNWRGGITIEYFDEKKHGEYVDDTGGISVKGKKVKSSGQQPTAKRRKRGKSRVRYRES